MKISLILSHAITFSFGALIIPVVIYWPSLEQYVVLLTEIALPILQVVGMIAIGVSATVATFVYRSSEIRRLEDSESELSLVNLEQAERILNNTFSSFEKDLEGTFHSEGRNASDVWSDAARGVGRFWEYSQSITEGAHEIKLDYLIKEYQKKFYMLLNKHREAFSEGYFDGSLRASERVKILHWHYFPDSISIKDLVEVVSFSSSYAYAKYFDPTTSCAGDSVGRDKLELIEDVDHKPQINDLWLFNVGMRDYLETWRYDEGIVPSKLSVESAHIVGNFKLVPIFE